MRRSYSRLVWSRCNLVFHLFSAFILLSSAFGKENPGFPIPGKEDPFNNPQPANLSAVTISSNGWFRLHADVPPDHVYEIQSSSNLLEWRTIATLLNAPFDFIDPGSNSGSSRYYRVLTMSRGETNDWKNQVQYPYDDFLSDPDGNGDSSRWVKFAIKMDEPNRVYYQNSLRYRFHYDFAKARLAPFAGMSRDAFDQVSLHPTNNQQVVLGAVIFSPDPTQAEYGIQFVGLESYPKETIQKLFEVVKSSVAVPDGAAVFYMPVLEQLASAESSRDYFESKGIQLSSSDRWTIGDGVYSAGWALGRLIFIPAGQIEAAYAEGRLRPTDILLTDGVPAEVPFVAGIVSLAPATPNSHVAILAKSYGVPFVYLADPAKRILAQTLADKDIILRVSDLFGISSVDIIDASGNLDPATKAEIAALKNPPPVVITPKASFGAITASTENLQPSDIKFFGGKAANFGILRRTVPESVPQAIALSFDLWDAFLNQTLPNGKALRAEIQQRLSRYTYPADVASLKGDLAAIRDIITKTAKFSTEQQEQIKSSLASFDPLKKIRFRSSTNVEDSDSFSGAGLYDSYSGCLADDQDNNNSGPCLCDPTEEDERGVFRAIQKVYASFYNDNAFLERLRHGIDENQVGMAILVHHSYPDEIELANGVATVTKEGPDSYSAKMVTQLGAESVTNPDMNSRPEIVNVSQYTFGTYAYVQQRSSLVLLGANVLEWDKDYKDFMAIFTDVAKAYGQTVGKTNFILDFEYKKVAPGRLEVKQVREIPSQDQNQRWTPFLVNQPTELCVFQGEFGDVFSNHRLKSRLNLSSKTFRLVSSNLQSTVFSEGAFHVLNGTNVASLTGTVSSWPGATHKYGNESIVQRWSVENGNNPRQFELTLEGVPSSVPVTRSPLVLLSDLTITLKEEYSTPQPVFGYMGEVIMATNASVRLQVCRGVQEGDLLQERNWTVGNGKVKIQTRFYWPRPPRGATAGYTAPLVAWVETKIEGLTSTPISLKGYYSQTYRPEHHNFSEHFLFEPQLEEGISASILMELQAANIKAIHAMTSDFQPQIQIIGMDDKLRILE